MPLGRFGAREEIAATVAFLAGDGAAFVGETLSPNGGIITRLTKESDGRREVVIVEAV